MKIGITRLSGNITDKNRESVGNKEMIAIANLLQKYSEVDILTCKECCDCVHVDENYDINKYDCLLIVNDSTNMFGGCEITTMTTIYKLLHKFDKQIYYILTDLSLPFVDYYELIKNKKWNNYNECDFKLKNDIIILSQAYNLDIVKKIHKNIKYKDVIYIPFQEWKVFTEKIIDNNVPKKVDLIYGGSFRTGRREKKFIDYFFDKNNLDILIYGNMKLSQFKNVDGLKPPIFKGKIPNQMVLMANSTSLATILLGDKNYNDNIVTLRFVEALLSNVICFIDNDFDTKHRLLDDYFYVNNGKELEEKILEIKNDNMLYYSLLSKQQAKLLEILNNNLPLKLFEVLERNNI